MTETVYSGCVIENIIVSHPHHDEYNSVRWWYNGAEISPREIEVVVYNEKDYEDD